MLTAACCLLPTGASVPFPVSLAIHMLPLSLIRCCPPAPTPPSPTLAGRCPPPDLVACCRSFFLYGFDVLGRCCTVYIYIYSIWFLHLLMPVYWLSPVVEVIEANLARSCGKNGRPDPPLTPRKSLVKPFAIGFGPRCGFIN